MLLHTTSRDLHLHLTLANVITTALGKACKMWLARPHAEPQVCHNEIQLSLLVRATWNRFLCHTLALTIHAWFGPLPSTAPVVLGVHAVRCPPFETISRQPLQAYASSPSRSQAKHELFVTYPNICLKTLPWLQPNYLAQDTLGRYHI